MEITLIVVTKNRNRDHRVQKEEYRCKKWV
jgi:hypothetical protein